MKDRSMEYLTGTQLVVHWADNLVNFLVLQKVEMRGL